jgi:hypothetical protein
MYQAESYLSQLLLQVTLSHDQFSSSGRKLAMDLPGLFCLFDKGLFFLLHLVLLSVAWSTQVIAAGAISHSANIQ